jgi:tryptophan-rich sensory protein
MQQQLRRTIGGLDGKDTLVALGFVVAVNLIGASPTLLFGGDTSWIDKPSFFPPEAAFPIVWTTIFTLCGIALFLLWRQGIENRPVKLAFGAFAGQFVLNLVWTPVFFGLQRPDLGLVVIVLLLGALSATIYAFDRVDRRAALLLVPYLLWGIYATALNVAIYLSWSG